MSEDDQVLLLASVLSAIATVAFFGIILSGPYKLMWLLILTAQCLTTQHLVLRSHYDLSHTVKGTLEHRAAKIQDNWSVVANNVVNLGIIILAFELGDLQLVPIKGALALFSTVRMFKKDDDLWPSIKNAVKKAIPEPKEAASSST